MEDASFTRWNIKTRMADLHFLTVTNTDMLVWQGKKKLKNKDIHMDDLSDRQTGKREQLYVCAHVHACINSMDPIQDGAPIIWKK